MRLKRSPATSGLNTTSRTSEPVLDLPEIDAVWVCTPTFQHPAPVIAAAKAGKHVFCEKPMALKVADARRMANACRQADVRLTIGFVRRFDTQWGKLKEVVQSGAVGSPVIWRFAWGGPPGPLRGSAMLTKAVAR